MGTVKKSTQRWPYAFKKRYIIAVPVPIYTLEYLQSLDAVDIEYTLQAVDITENIGYSIQELFDYESSRRSSVIKQAKQAKFVRAKD